MDSTKGAATPSSSTAGFFQTLPTLEPQFTLPSKVSTSGSPAATPQALSDDPVLARILALYLPPGAQQSVGAALHDVSRYVLLPSTLQHAVDAETSPPTLQALTTFGQVNAVDPLRTSEGWRALKRIGVEHGVVSRAYDAGTARSHNRRVDQFAVCHAWSHTSTLTMCPMTMTDGAATLVAKHLREMGIRKAVFEEAYRRLTSDKPEESWTSGQWMTERSGGSDVRGTETVARRLTDDEVRPWRIDGFKWFSSATDSDLTMLLAQTGKGLSAFLVPMRRQSATSRATSELNGIRIQRLKNKMGTKGLPTAELELVGSRGWLVGEEGKGVKHISVILNITRLHTAMGSVSGWSRGLAVCRAYSKIRKIRGDTLLTENAQHVVWMAGETVKYWASTQLAFFGAALMGCVEQGREIMGDTPAGSSGLIPKDTAHIADLLRLLTPVMKAQCSMAAVSGLRSCMECLGGVGYCENHEDGGILNIAKLFRDSVVNTIWEGTVSVMADDVGRVLRDKRIAGGRIIEDVFAGWVRSCLSAQDGREAPSLTTMKLVVEERLQALVKLVEAVKKDAGELEYRGRDLLDHLEVLTSAVVLLSDAQTDGDEVATHVATRYVWSRVVMPQSQNAKPRSSWQTESAIDRKIFLGVGYNASSKRPLGKL
ncbi:acyl-CoA dehydrogenase/oxidase [Microdochium bolleyi]|uniref:Acyl-CoA dehydrogenase/oxidase n=1 Tax=Microdochium bolleyi TaxID=196109 RepID=A0A136JFV4_9PEZI|nr:acyl-CoA dehydrogenase/oxidase [Microdochium bolleyi]